MASPKMELDPKYDHYDFPTTSPTVQSGHPGHTTPEQDAQVHQLRMALEQLGYKDRLDTLTMVLYNHAFPIRTSDVRQLRFLRARKFNVEHAKEMSGIF